MSSVRWYEFRSIASAVWIALGPLIGVWTGAYLSKRWQRDQWIADNKRAEYRKLITTLTDLASKVAIYYGPNARVLDPAAARKVAKISLSSANIIFNRLFIDREMKELDIQARWQNALVSLRTNNDPLTFTTAIEKLMEDIKREALKEFLKI